MIQFLLTEQIKLCASKQAVTGEGGALLHNLRFSHFPWHLLSQIEAFKKFGYRCPINIQKLILPLVLLCRHCPRKADRNVCEDYRKSSFYGRYRQACLGMNGLTVTLSYPLLSDCIVLRKRGRIALTAVGQCYEILCVHTGDV